MFAGGGLGSISPISTSIASAPRPVSESGHIVILNQFTQTPFVQLKLCHKIGKAKETWAVGFRVCQNKNGLYLRATELGSGRVVVILKNPDGTKFEQAIVWLLLDSVT